jgi:hypothetical protein
VESGITRLVDAVAAGADVVLLLDKQEALKAERQAVGSRLTELEKQFAAMPDAATIGQQAVMMRVGMMGQYQNRNWRELPYDEVRAFLRFLFGDNPRDRGHGIFVEKVKDKWRITFKGVLEFNHEVLNGRPVSGALAMEAKRYSNQLKAMVRKTCGEQTGWCSRQGSIRATAPSPERRRATIRATVAVGAARRRRRQARGN